MPDWKDHSFFPLQDHTQKPPAVAVLVTSVCLVTKQMTSSASCKFQRYSPWCRAQRNVLLDTASRCSKRCTNSAVVHAKYATTLLRLLYWCRSVQNRTGQFGVGSRSGATLTSSTMRQIGYLLFSTVLVLRPHFTFARTPYILPLGCSAYLVLHRPHLVVFFSRR